MHLILCGTYCTPHSKYYVRYSIKARVCGKFNQIGEQEEKIEEAKTTKAPSGALSEQMRYQLFGYFTTVTR